MGTRLDVVHMLPLQDGKKGNNAAENDDLRVESSTASGQHNRKTPDFL